MSDTDLTKTQVLTVRNVILRPVPSNMAVLSLSVIGSYSFFHRLPAQPKL
jgi:hypothetical protein